MQSARAVRRAMRSAHRSIAAGRGTACRAAIALVRYRNGTYSAAATACASAAAAAAALLLAAALLVAPGAARAEIGAAAAAREEAGFRAGRALLEEASDSADAAPKDPMDPEKVKQMFAEMDLQGSIDRARCKRRQKKLDATARQYYKTYKKMHKDGQIKKAAFKKAKEWVEKEHLFASAKLAQKCQKLVKKSEKSELK